MKLSTELANQAWDVLVRLGGAVEENRTQFLDYVTKDSEYHHEYRFGGHFGMGGKFRLHEYAECPMYMDYYWENETAELNLLQKQVNDALVELWKKETR